MYVRRPTYVYRPISKCACVYVCTNACMHYVCIMCVCMACMHNSASGSTVALCPSHARVQKEGRWREADTAAVKSRLMKSNGRWRRVNWKTPRCGRRMERRWTPTRAKNKASPNSLETHLVKKWGDIGHLRALSPWSNGCLDVCLLLQRGVLSELGP